jgi:hypothetical protein
MTADQPWMAACFRSERVVCCIAVARQRYKIVQLIFQKRDGSVLVTVPYGPKCDGLVSAATMPVHGTQMNLSGRPLKYSAYFREGVITGAANLVACRRSPRIRWC